MPDCQYCGQRFDSEEALHDHLTAAHPDELGPIDRRKLGLTEDDGGGPNWGLVALVLVVAGILGIIVGVLWLGAGEGTGDSPEVNADQEPTDLWAVHYHGTIEMVINDQPVDFSRSRYQMQADAFHFENGDGTRWHGHARQVTLEWAMGSLGIQVTESSVAIGDQVYQNSTEGTTVIIRVNGESVDPSQYILSEGDHIRIKITTS